MKKKSLFLGLSLLTCASFSLASCVKTSNTDTSKKDDPTTSSNTATSTTVVPSSTTTTIVNEDSNKAIVTFVTNGGIDVPSQELNKGEKALEPTTSKPTTAQYTYSFDGWYIDSEFSTKFNFNTEITGNITLYAKWNQTVNKYTITWLDSDEEVIKYEQVEYGVVPSFTPTKQSDEYTYTFVGWNEAPVAVTGNATYKAVWTTARSQFDVKWVNYDNSELDSEKYEYGVTPSYKGAIPTKEATAQYTYTFNGWEPQVDAVTGNVVYKAKFSETVNKYTITWQNFDGSELESKEVEYGTVPTQPVVNPTRAADETYTYSFKGWDSEIVAVTGAKTYKAEYDENYINYTISFVDYDGTNILTKTDYHFNDNVVLPSNPERLADQQYTYTFDGWDSEVVSVNGNKTYTAKYKSTVKEYAITWMNGDELLTTTKVAYGSVPTYSGETPVKESDQQSTYTFDGWTVNPVSVTGNATYYAKFKETKNKYLITWKNGNTTIYSQEVEYGSVPSYIGANPTKLADNTYTYTFKGWDSEVVAVTGAKTYEAQFDEEYIDYTISFVDYDGTPISSKTNYHYGDTVVTPTDPERAKTAQYTYTFDGWDSEVVTVAGNKTYTAKYKSTVNKYTITWMNGDALLTTTEVEYGTLPTYNGVAPTKAADQQYTYSFAGWTVTPVAVTEETTYYAKYNTVTNKYLITWKNGDSVIYSQEVEYGQTPVFTGSEPTKAQDQQYTYTFDGWDTEVVAVTGAKTYTAKYIETYIDYTITFVDWNDGIILTKTDYHFGDTVEIPTNPTRTNTAEYTYTFKEWDSEVVTVAGNKTYKAIYNEVKNSYDVVFNTNGGTSISPVSVEYGKKVSEPIAPTKDDFNFAGWYTDSNCENLYDFNTPITGTLTLYANWVVTPVLNYTVTFVYDQNDSTKNQTSIVLEGKTVVEPYTPTKEGNDEYSYTFAGWYTNKELTNQFDFATPITTDTTLYVKFNEVKNKYTITWKNGTAIIYSQEVEYGQLPVFTGSNPTKLADNTYTYTFKGWDSEVVAVTGAKTYEAQFDEEYIDYTISFVDYDGTPISSKTNYHYGDTVVTPTDPERAKTAQYTYTFDGWDTEVVTVAGNKTYTAKYQSTVNKYTITWMNGDELLTTTEVEYGTLPTYNGVAPTKTADQQYTYSFAGWTVTPVAVTEATTYYAKYNTVTNKYLITWKNGESVIYSQEVEYGQTPVFTGSEPTKAKDQQYTYTFDGWDTEVVAVTGAKTYTAKYSTTVNKYTITWVNYDGTELASNEVEYGTLPTYTGETPVKPNDSQYSYTFNGWNSEVVAVTGAKTYTAVFTNNVNKYTITWVNWNDDVLEVDENVSYNAMPEYNGETPTKAANQQYTFTFAGWDTIISAVTGDKTYKATFNSVVNKYTITWKNGDTVIYSQEVEYGQTPVFTGSEPTKAKDQQYTYTFDGWDTEVVAVTGAKTYTAKYSTTLNEYTITWMNGDTLLDTTNVAYGEVPTYTGETPTKASTVEKTYTFAGWTVDPVAVTGAATYYAKFDESANKYNIKFVNGSITLQEGLVEYGQLPTYEGETPTKNSTDEWDYTFIGWDKSFTQVTGDETYTALFTSTKRRYTVTWKNGDDVLYSEKVEYGVTPSYTGITPTKSSTVQYDFEFVGWGTVVSVTGDVNYTAQFNNITRKYTYTFFKEDGINTYKVVEADYGTAIVAPSNPTKSGSLSKTYSFAGWYTAKDAGELVSDFGTLTGNVGYFARFNEIDKKYTITWMDGTNVLDSLSDVTYDTDYPNGEPTKAGYTFEKWEEVINDTTIIRTAIFTENKEQYTVTWLNDDDTLLRNDIVDKNAKASYGTKPAKSGYKFVYWANNGVEFDVENTNITSDITLKAVYAEVYSVGFGSSYTPWSEIVNQAGSSVTTDTKGRYVLNADVTLNGYTFLNNDKNLVAKDQGSYNNQGSDIVVTLAKEGSLFVNCTWASTSSSGYITVKDSSNNEKYKSELISGSGVSCSFSIEDLPSGTYTIHSDYSINISNIHYEVVKEYANVNFVTNVQGSTIDPVRVVVGTTLSELPELQRDGYKLLGWCTDIELNNNFDISTTIDTDTILYAKWAALTAAEMATVTFSINVLGESIPSVTIEKGTTVYLPTKDISGYRFDGWYTDIIHSSSFNPATIIDEDTTIYGNYIKQFTITYQDKDGNVIGTKKVDEDTPFGEVATVSAPYISGYLFEYWTKDDVEFTSSDDITSDIVLKAHYKQDDGTSEKIVITKTEGLQESAYVLFNEYDNADNYSLYEIDSSNNTRRLTNKDYYITRTTTGFRADLFGLKAGNHKIMVAPEIGGSDVISLAAQTSFTIEEYDRSGYAHFNYTEGVGAYKDDGTLKDNAIVLYVTDQNKNTIELTYGGITVKGIGNILNSVGQACSDAGHENECKKVSSGKTYYGTANTNQGILKKLAEANIPLVVRFVGCVSNTGLYKKGTFNAANTSLIEGLTEYDSNNYGGSEGDNGHMARIKSGKNITLEGVGSDATIDGWGFHFMCSSDAPELGKSFEVRNLKFINTPEDAIGMEGVQSGSVISASVERCWIHNNEFYSPSISNPAESDKSEGDGSCDFKRGMYFTCSYNYFEGCHKTNLVGSSDSSLQYNLTYHHNYWYMCKARGPLTRQANVHMYNNIFYGQTDFAMNTRANAYIFSESNLFYACKNPFRVDAGAIKSYNDSVSSAVQNYTSATIVTDKNTVVANENCKYNGVVYSSFELNSSLFYKDNYYLQEDPTDAKKVIYARCGTSKASLPAIEDITMDDISYVNEAVQNVTVNNLAVNGQTVNTGKISKTIYAFKITESAKAKITYQYDTDDKTGILCNQAGVALLKASGTVELKPGIYFIQPYNFQPGDSKALSQLVFKEIASVSIKLDEFDDSEYQNTLISEFNDLVNSLPSTIEYTDTCFNKINAAFAKYNQLNEQSKVTVSAKYNTLTNANNTYKNKGINYVETKINEIVTPVTESNADYVYAAREAYNELLNKVPSATVSNYNTLVTAEAQLEKVAVNVFLSKVQALPSTITYTSECLAKIVAAENAYDSLTAEQKALEDDDADVVSAYAILVQARNTYNNLEEEQNKVTVTFVAEGLTIDPVRIKKDTKLSLPQDPYKVGYRFDGWYTNAARTIAFDSNSLIDTDTTLYAKFVEQVTVTFINMDGTTILTTRSVDKNSAIATSVIPNAKFESGYKFSHWSLSKNGSEFDISTDISANTTLYAVYTVSSIESVKVSVYGGDLESLYAEFNKLNGFTDYNVYVRRDGESLFKSVDKQLIREYDSYYRVDALGLQSGTYSIKVVPFADNTEITEAETIITNISVKEHIRTGFAFVNGSASGAYNNDGTLRSDATVIYVTNTNKDTVTFNGATGVQNIIALLKSNKGYSKPICIRFIGNITDPAMLQKGDLYVDTATAGLTIEGVGKDATINGFGIVIKNSSNVEIRNIGFMNCNSSEGDSIGLQQGNDHCWVHNNDIFYGDAGSDADQVKGDGALDTKKSTYITHSFNHFWDTGKSNLQGMKDETTSNYITYHHNWYDHSDSRHPRIRTCTVHIYNNYFDGNAKYGVGMTMGGSAFVENNYFRSTATMKPMLISGQGTDAQGEGTFSGETGGVIKAYGNKFDGNVSFISHTQNATSFDAYVATSRNEVVPNTIKALSGGTTYNNFDTNTSLMYTYSVETPDEAKNTVTSYAGRVQGGDFTWTFNNAVDDSSYAVNNDLKSTLMAYTGKLVKVLGIEGSTQGGETPTPDTSIEDVINMIEALPEPANVTLDNTSAIYAARTAYQKLSTEQQASVTNYSKLQQCIQRLNELGNDDEEQQGAQILTFPNSNSFFTVSGSTSTSKGTATYNNTTYSTCLKVESGTSIKFTTNATTTLTIVFGTADNGKANIKIDGVKETGNSNYVLTITLDAGTHEITKADKAFIFYLSIE